MGISNGLLLGKIQAPRSKEMHKVVKDVHRLFPGQVNKGASAFGESIPAALEF